MQLFRQAHIRMLFVEVSREERLRLGCSYGVGAVESTGCFEVCESPDTEWLHVELPKEAVLARLTSWTNAMLLLNQLALN